MERNVSVIAPVLLLIPLSSVASTWPSDRIFENDAIRCDICNFDRKRERLDILSRYKMDLNMVDIDDLLDIPGLSISQAAEIIRLRQQLGGFTSYRELNNISSVNAYDLEVIRQFTLIDKLANANATYKQSSGMIFLGDSGSNTADPINSDSKSSQTLVETEAENTYGYQFLAQVNNSPRYSSNYDNESGLINTKVESGWHEKRLALTKTHRDPAGYNARWVLGDYNLGFAEGLTINTGYKSHSSGIYSFTPYHVDFYKSDIIQHPALQGIAYQQRTRLSSLRLGYTLYASSTLVNLAKKEFTYGPNPDIANRLGTCNNPGAKKYAFTCFADGNWRTWFTKDASNSDTLFQSSALENVLQESLFGQQFSLAYARHHVGLLHYQSSTKLLIDAPMFSLSPFSAYPADENISSTGIYYQYAGASYISTELSLTQNNDLSSVIRWHGRSIRHFEPSVSVRNIKSAHSNPHMNVESASDFIYIPSPRNEQGARLALNAKWRMLRYDSIFDVWRYSDLLDSHGKWINADDSQLRAYARQMISLALRPPRINDIQLIDIGADWTDQDIRLNGRKESYIGKPDKTHGQRRRLLLDYQSINSKTRFRWRYVNAWIDTMENTQGFSHQANISGEIQLQFAATGFIQIALFKSIQSLDRGTAEDEIQTDIMRQTSIALGYRFKHRLQTYLRVGRLTSREFDTSQQSEQIQTWDKLLLELNYSD